MTDVLKEQEIAYSLSQLIIKDRKKLRFENDSSDEDKDSNGDDNDKDNGGAGARSWLQTFKTGAAAEKEIYEKETTKSVAKALTRDQLKFLYVGCVKLWG